MKCVDEMCFMLQATVWEANHSPLAFFPQETRITKSPKITAFSMAPSPARRGTGGTRRGGGLLVFLLLLATPSTVHSKYAHGARRAGRRLVNHTSIQQRHVRSPLHCLALCDGEAECRALHFGAVSSATNCELLADRACDGHRLVDDPTVDYYDVYAKATSEHQLPLWSDPICLVDGLCAADCGSRGVGEPCSVDLQCQRADLEDGSYRCLDGTCQPMEGFWEVRPGFLLPRWMSWTADWMLKSFKRLKLGHCSLDIKLKLGMRASWSMIVSHGYQGSGIQFLIDDYNNVTEIPYKSITGTDLVNTENFTHLTLSWCNNSISMGPVDNPRLLTTETPTASDYEYVTVLSERNCSWMYIDSGVADPWLFEESGTEPDPVFEMSGSWSPYSNVLIGRYIKPSFDVTVKYDCFAEYSCHTYLYSDRFPASPYMNEARLKVIIGGYTDRAYGLILQHWPEEYENHGCCNQWPGTPILNVGEFVTFTVHFNIRQVTVLRNDDPEPVLNATIPDEWMTYLLPITRVAFGSYGLLDSPKRVRVARYDSAWATDTWRTDHTGFSSMAFDQP